MTPLCPGTQNSRGSAVPLTPLRLKSAISKSNIFANSKPYAKRLKPVYQGPIEKLIDEKNQRLKIS
jgi:hypothetical protein